MQFWWHVLVICEIELILLSALSYQFIAFIQQILCRKNDWYFFVRHNSNYIRIAEHTFNDRLYKHNNSFKYESERNSTKLSNFIGSKKKENINVNLDWSILDTAKPYSLASKEKMHLMSYREISHNFLCKESVE